MSDVDLFVAMPRVAFYMNRVHGLLEATMAPLTLDDVRYLKPNGTANTIAGTYFHIACGYERLVQRELLAAPTIFDRDGWSASLQVSVDSKPNDQFFVTMSETHYAELRAYVASVLDEMVSVVGGMTREQVSAQTPGGAFGSAQVGELLLWPMLFHTSHHFGEISALVGVRGKAGLPF